MCIRILQESLIALKTILKEIDPFAFEEALRMNAIQRKQFSVKQDEEDRKNLDKKWEKLNQKLKQTDGSYSEPEGISLTLSNDYSPLQIIYSNQRFQR